MDNHKMELFFWVPFPTIVVSLLSTYQSYWQTAQFQQYIVPQVNLILIVYTQFAITLQTQAEIVPQLLDQQDTNQLPAMIWFGQNNMLSIS